MPNPNRAVFSAILGNNLRMRRFTLWASAIVFSTALIATVAKISNEQILLNIERLSPRKRQEISEERLTAKGRSLEHYTFKKGRDYIPFSTNSCYL